MVKAAKISWWRTDADVAQLDFTLNGHEWEEGHVCDRLWSFAVSAFHLWHVCGDANTGVDSVASVLTLILWP